MLLPRIVHYRECPPRGDGLSTVCTGQVPHHEIFYLAMQISSSRVPVISQAKKWDCNRKRLKKLFFSNQSTKHYLSKHSWTQIERLLTNRHSNQTKPSSVSLKPVWGGEGRAKLQRDFHA